ncbi:MAG: three-Cys-motif partner protein TcmP [Elusimicrobiota bacterium]|nr:three-Cys-motif partner protein TcmP [Elusimicrobiota bacterium]
MRAHPNPEVKIFFNDIEPTHTENLKKELTAFGPVPHVAIVGIVNKPFTEVLKQLLPVLSAKSPKFFFLDPFTYSTIKLEDIKLIIESHYTEVLLFLPAQDVYRFAATENIPPGTRNFLTNFTTKGIYDYEGIEDFNESICQKFREAFGLKFVRPILLDGGQRKHTLFLLTRHIRGMMLANKIFWDKSPDGLGIRDGIGEQHLFNTGTCSEDFRQYTVSFEDTLKSQGSMTNQQIIEHTATHGFLAEHTKKILDDLKKTGRIAVTHIGDGKKGYYIAENNWDKAKSIIKYNR